MFIAPGSFRPTVTPNARSARIEAALRYWKRQRGAQAMPTRAAIDPTDIPPLLPYVLLIDVLSDPLDFRFQLIGSSVDSIIGQNYRGVRFSELPHMAPGNKVWDEYVQVVEQKQPLTSEIPYVGRAKLVRHLSHCLMPLSSDQETVDAVFTVVEINLDGSSSTTSREAPALAPLGGA
ncbi:MAG: PAS domain-containing protein [Alphaproteobacteria bacterium]|nr:PAS domain-containing protein [Alphaproteobacteria bacterium]